MEDSENPWWEKHLVFKSDSIAKAVVDSPETTFLVIASDVVQLAKDFLTLKRKFRNICLFNDIDIYGYDEWDALSSEEKAAKRAEWKKVREEIHKIFVEQNPTTTD